MKNLNFPDFYNKRLVQHLIFWLFYLSLLAIRIAGRQGPGMEGELFDIIEKETIRCITLLIGVYINLRIIIPTTFNKDKYYNFVLFNLITAFILSFISVWSIELLQIEPYNHLAMPARMLWSTFHISLFITVTSLLHFTKEWIKLKDLDINIKTLKNEKLAAELESLKGQLNPHFLFNTLNNLYSLSLIKSDDAPNMIIKLSDLMSYIIYDSKVDYISMKKEIAFTSNYISLEKLRLQEHLNLKIDINCTDDERMIAPLLFMPFIENAFKYTPKDTDKSFIYIKIETIENGPIQLRVENSKDIVAIENKDNKHSGLGIQNVSKRLELIYPGNHLLTVEDKEDTFIVNLVINDLKK